MAGRPSKYKPEHAKKICELISLGGGLQDITAKNKELPSVKTIFEWLNRHDDFRADYEQARKEQQDFEADNMLKIADEAEQTPSGIAKARLRIETRRWRAERLNAGKYGAQSSILLNASGGAQAITGSAQELFNLFKAISEANAPGGNIKVVDNATQQALPQPDITQ